MIRSDSLRVEWPDGRVNLFYDVAKDQELLIVQGQNGFTTVPQPGRKMSL